MNKRSILIILNYIKFNNKQYKTQTYCFKSPDLICCAFPIEMIGFQLKYESIKNNFVRNWKTTD